MKERMKEPYEKGLANRSAPSFAPRSVRGEAKRKQGIGGLGIELRHVQKGKKRLMCSVGGSPTEAKVRTS